MNSIRSLLGRLTLALALLVTGATLGAAPALAAGEETDQDMGQIEVLDFAAGKVIIDGLMYWAGPDLRVEINGTYGAFTMLKTGMYVNMEYRIKPGEQRELFSLKEVMEGGPAEES